MTSDCPEILCGLLIPSQLPPYKISLKTKEPISFCPREVPSENAKCPRNVHDTPMMPPRFWSIFKTARANCTKFGGDVPLAKKCSHAKFQPNWSTSSTAIPIWNSTSNLQTFATFSKRGFTRQTTSDWPEILCALLIPPQLSPYKYFLKTHEPISLCRRKVPSDSANCPWNVHDAPTTPPRFYSIFQTTHANREKFSGDVPLAKKHSHTKFQPNRSTTSTAIPIWNSASNL